jgi:mannose-6-phosphate isomerase-like protein (cupin superfamily)
MILLTADGVFASGDANRYWADFFPEWAALTTFIGCEHGPSVIEPHYHDNDEFWLWVSGEGKARLNHGPQVPFAPGTVVYCPMGAVHEFTSPTAQYNIGVTTRLQGLKRPLHLHVDEHGSPAHTAEGFIVDGAGNHGVLSNGTECPLAELRLIEAAAGHTLATDVAGANEYWLVVSGTLALKTDTLSSQLGPRDLVVLREGAHRQLQASDTSLVALAREWPGPRGWRARLHRPRALEPPELLALR